ncbi:putative 54S ribosomal protein MRP49 [Fusarium oxysporum f. sp. albedinis]|nr:putative 54S ribosomal protein MRP49 [Fusarium oxysporum f. sp. albedinis]
MDLLGWAWLRGVFDRRFSSVIGGTHTSDGRAASGRAVACLPRIYGEKRPTARCAPLRGHDRCPFISDSLSSLFILRSVWVLSFYRDLLSPLTTIIVSLPGASSNHRDATLKRDSSRAISSVTRRLVSRRRHRLWPLPTGSRFRLEFRPHLLCCSTSEPIPSILLVVDCEPL